MTQFLQNGKVFRPSDETSMKVHKTLPVGNYVISKDPFENMYFEKVDNFNLSDKLYGDTHRYTDRILSTYFARDNSTGVLLSGEKGSGKTMLAKNLVITAANLYEIPTIIINQPWSGDRFNKFIQDIAQPAIILFDEFEKVYDRETQEVMLTLLDGVFPSKKLFILTCNDKWRIDAHMRNRPGRIYYSIEFNGLSSEFITEYCEDNLKNKSHIKRLVKIAGVFDKFNFDMMKALVEEMNRYDETPEQALELLNAKVEYAGDRVEYAIELYKGELKIEDCDSSWTGNPLVQSVWIDYSYTLPNQEDPTEVTTGFSAEDLIALDPVGGTMTFKKDEFKLVLTRKKSKKVNVFDIAF